MAGLGFILFDGLGINTDGFYDDKTNAFFDVRSGEQDDRTVTVFPKGEFNKLLAQFQKISFAN